jgi:3-oxoacyl-[acyl-carrier protein] reductase
VSPQIADLTDRPATRRIVSAIEREHGPVEVLVNNAGMTQVGVPDSDAPVHQLAPSEWDRQIAITLTTAFNVVHEVLGSLIGRGWGRIVNVSSVTGPLVSYAGQAPTRRPRPGWTD